jgi:mRNA degradation ribonuclease J1/J2
MKIANALTDGYLRKCSLELRQRKVDGIVLHILAKTVDRLQQYVDLAQVANRDLVFTTRVHFFCVQEAGR